MLNRPTVRVQCRFSELEACALKRASLRAPSSFANAETIVENQMKSSYPEMSSEMFLNTTRL